MLVNNLLTITRMKWMLTNDTIWQIVVAMQ